ncbi:MAG: hypothetical protein HYV45_00830 [Candidatus Moranbacteria bacterium]|nr:hypothetical protein [Candidatus Moranbacteria bacterium]
MNATRWQDDIIREEEGVSFFRNNIVRVLMGGTIFFLLTHFFVLAYFARPTERSMILHYNVYFGVEIQSAWWQLFLLPLAGVFFFMVHGIFARRLYRACERIAAYLLLLGAWMLNVGLLIAGGGVAFINY